MVCIVWPLGRPLEDEIKTLLTVLTKLAYGLVRARAVTG